MLIQLDWLKEYVEFDVPTEELAEILSMGGLEIEALDWVALPDGTKTQVMEVNVTPNRGYCLSYRGMAREVAALLGKTCQWDDPEQELEQSWGPKPGRTKAFCREPGRNPVPTLYGYGDRKCDSRTFPEMARRSSVVHGAPFHQQHRRCHQLRHV